MNNQKILVIGSLNIDLMVQVDNLPVPGETLTAKQFDLLPGGKGMNQAVCAAKLGADVTMAGCIGDDAYGSILKQTLQQVKINATHLKVVSGTSTGTAIVTTSPKDNNIIVVPGANACVDKDYIDSIKEEIKQADLVILQLEIPLETVYYIIDLCEQEQVKVLLNPAPARELKEEYIKKVTYLIPNETELASIFDGEYRQVLTANPNKIIMTAGADGAYVHDGTKVVHCEANKVEVKDTTGAGDSFNAAFAVAVVRGKSIKEAVEYANGIAAITTTVTGAQGADADRYKRQS